MTAPPRRRKAHRRRGPVLAAAALCAALAGQVGPALPAAAAPAATAGSPTVIGAVTGFARSGAVYTFTAGTAKARVSFVSADTFRIEAAPDGTFTDPVGTDIVLPQGAPPATRWADRGDRYELSTDQVTLRVYKSPLRFALYRADGTRLWEESRGLSWDATSTTQTLARGADEQFYGTGEQNGSGNTSQRGRTLKVGVDYDWNEGGHPNSVPFYLSSAGYGVYRNTYAPGTYAFTDPVTTTEQERRFDAYYFAGNSAKDVIGRYTELTGRPMLPPVYGLEIGDSDCYLHNANRGERHTLDALKIADDYVENDMPLGWMLVNDGYGCGYENLAETAKGLGDRKMQMGLWTEDGLDKLADQVKAGQRVAKLDVAWVGDGYKFALDGCKAAYRGIEDNSDARGFTWAPESWSGAQRCGVQWSGDQSGGWDYIRWQIPTYAGATMSGLAYTTGDVDGIFGGSAKTYTRDLQWKAFLPAVMTMDGWAAQDKQPYQYGEPYTGINRTYLKLKESLLPYMYTYAAEAHRTGVGPVRPLALEYPDDAEAASDAAKYEFLTGEDFLVAPVYTDTTVRDGIYLPKGDWIDYWSGRTYHGPATVDGYRAPLDTLPLFVKAGASIPMWPGIRSYRDRTPDSPLAWDVYPQGRTSFTLYEDDGVTRQHRDGKYAEQRVTVSAPERGAGAVRIAVGAAVGDYAGKQTSRPYRFTVHTGSAPGQVRLDGRTLPRLTSKAAFDAAGQGWWYDASDRGGVVQVKTRSLSTDRAFRLDLDGASAVGGKVVGASGTVSLTPPEEIGAGMSGKVTVGFTAGRTGADATELSLSAPDGWTVSPARPLGRVEPGRTARAEFTVTAPAGTAAGETVLTATARYRAAGEDRVTAERAALRTMPAPPKGDVHASDLPWLNATNGYGPAERDRSNGESAAGDGHTLTLNGTTYAKGIGAHADSDIEFWLGGQCSALTATVGIDDEINGYGGVSFSVVADGRTVWSSPTVSGRSDPVPVDVPLAGARHVHLVVTDTDGTKSGDHGDWADATFHCA
ncbi:NPCBM/NEW2 domain-containing protein [Streptomyces mexicanus]|uniref:NPCBM/NEW2 domain-containing protein n=1 Tax=Streptomyces mexicanus TaxID=178566 RepID=A0A7X1HX55_9ACTN|nr:NPCBM/NEW2 domain-containing protein [Streptomyces mexicanus]MBC2864677.1 NPCBM/NEW2 domain-containing protein [Streptomyces mexicanus]